MPSQLACSKNYLIKQNNKDIFRIVIKLDHHKHLMFWTISVLQAFALTTYLTSSLPILTENPRSKLLISYRPSNRNAFLQLKKRCRVIVHTIVFVSFFFFNFYCGVCLRAFHLSVSRSQYFVALVW